MTPVTIRRSALGKLASFLLIVLIASPFTAPFSTMSGALEASPSGPADSVQDDTTHTVATVEAPWVYEPSWSVASFRVLAPTAVVEFARVNRTLRL